MAQQNAPATSTEAKHAPKSLGSLEKLIMDALWASDGPRTVQEVVDALGPDHNYKTVMTVLNRLVDKELLGRQLDGRAYRYAPTQSRDDFLQAVADELISDYVETYGEGSASHLRKAIDAVAPPPVPAAAAAAPMGATAAVVPPAAVYEDQNGRRSSGLMGVIGVAAILQAITLFFRRGRRPR